MRVKPKREVLEKLRASDHFQEAKEKFWTSSGEEIPEMIQAFSANPDILQDFMAMRQHIYPGGNVERRLKDVVFVKVSDMNKCQFCLASHTAVLEKMFDFSRQEIEDIINARNLSEKETTVLQYAEQVTIDANKVTDELFNKLKQLFPDADIVELTMAIGLINMLNMFNNALQVQY